MNALDEKHERLQACLLEARRVAVAFSAGVDSTFLLAVAHEVLGDDAVAVTVASPFMPKGERAEAEGFCAERGIRLRCVELDPLSDESIRENTPERCYLCKRMIFSSIQEVAASEGCAVVMDGSNVDDAADFRPGMRALRELGIASPLMDAGLAKSDIRVLSQRLGLDTAAKPAMACLATRIPYGTTLAPDALERVAEAEGFLHGLGFGQVRVRDHGGLARIEVDPSEIVRLAGDAGVRQAVDDRLRELGYAYASVDLAGFRSGSMNVGSAVKGGMAAAADLGAAATAATAATTSEGASSGSRDT